MKIGMCLDRMTRVLHRLLDLAEDPAQRIACQREFQQRVDQLQEATAAPARDFQQLAVRFLQAGARIPTEMAADLGRVGEGIALIPGPRRLLLDPCPPAGGRPL